MIMSTPSQASEVLGRVAVVTGANKGIGYFIALQLGLSGLFQHVILACRNEQLAQTAVESIQAKVSVSIITTYPLAVGDIESHKRFVSYMEHKYGKVDCLVNNAAIAFKSADPTPHDAQTKPTLDVNYRGTLDFTERMLPLVRKGSDPRIVNVASMAGRLSQLSPELQTKFTSDSLTIPRLNALVDEFEQSVQDGSYLKKGWSRSNYGFSKLTLIAATKVLARENPGIAINSCCPGYCKTDMTSQGGTRPPEDGARNAVIPATMENPPTGKHFSDYKLGTWNQSQLELLWTATKQYIFG